MPLGGSTAELNVVFQTCNEYLLECWRPVSWHCVWL